MRLQRSQTTQSIINSSHLGLASKLHLIKCQTASQSLVKQQSNINTNMKFLGKRSPLCFVHFVSISQFADKNDFLSISQINVLSNLLLIRKSIIQYKTTNQCMERQEIEKAKNAQNRLDKKAFGLSLDLTTQQEHTIEKTELQANHLFKFIQQKKSNENKKKIEQLKRRITNRSYLMQKINHYIYEIAQRNGAIDANYAHFLMLLYLTIQQIVINIFPSQDLLSAQKFMFVKLQTQIVKKQISQSLYYEFMTFVLRKQKISTETIHSLMRKIMTEERQICIAIFPYYFNLFAMVLNKQIIFNDELEQKLISYSFQIKTDTRYNGVFTRQEVWKQIRRIQKSTIEKHHCPDL